jgi:hypothetical protein
MAALIGLWGIVVSLIFINGFAAGMVAILFAWRRSQRRGSRVLTAVVLTGLLPASMMVPALLAQASAGFESPAGMIIGTVGVFVLAMAGSLPGALIVARKLEAPGDEFRAFE